MWHGAGTGAILRRPLMGTGGALREFPFEAEQVPEEVGAPLRGRGGPGDFQAAGDRVAAFTRAKATLPAQALLLEAGRFGLGPHMGRRASAVGLAEGVAASNERHRLLVIHRHAGEGLADVPRRSDRIGVGVRTLGIDVDQAHLHCGEGILQVARVRLLAVVVGVDDAVPRDAGRAVRVADVAAEPFLLAAPIDAATLILFVLANRLTTSANAIF